MFLKSLPLEIQPMVLRHLDPNDLKTLLTVTGSQFLPLFSYFSDSYHPSTSSFFADVKGLHSQSLAMYPFHRNGAINIIEITDWTSLHLDHFIEAFSNKTNAITVTLNAHNEDLDSMDQYDNINIFLRHLLPKSHILIQGMVAGISINERDIVVPQNLTIMNSADVHIHAPDSTSDTSAINYQCIENLSIESYSSGYLENYNFEVFPSKSLHLDSIEPFTLRNITIAAQSAALEGIENVENVTFIGTDITLVAHPHLATNPNVREMCPSQFRYIYAPNAVNGAFFFDAVFPSIKDVFAPKLQHASFFSRTPHDIDLEDLPFMDDIDSDFSYLETVISIEVSIFDAPILMCPKFDYLQSMAVELVRPLRTFHNFPSLKRLSITLLSSYVGTIPDIDAPAVREYCLTVVPSAKNVVLQNLTTSLNRFQPLRRLSLDLGSPIDEQLRMKINRYISRCSHELKSLRLVGPDPLDILSDKRAMMPLLKELNLQGTFKRLSISLYAPELHSITINTVDRLSKVKIRGFPKLKHLTVRSPTDSLFVTRVPQLHSIFVGGVLSSFRSDYLPVIKDLMYTLAVGKTYDMIEDVDYMNPDVHRATLGDVETWLE